MRSPTHVAPRCTHVRRSHDADDLAAILDPAITLAIWERPSALPVGSLEGFEAIQMIAAVDHAGAMLAAAFALRPAAAWHDGVVADVATLVARFAAIMALSHVVIRLERVTGDACKRWHADYVAVRLICTYRGSGTQWIERSMTAGDASVIETQRSLDAGAVGLFKGRVLAGEQAILHRSPPIAGTGEERLLLVLDGPPPADIAALWESALQRI